jgi:hypothetical protein
MATAFYENGKLLFDPIAANFFGLSLTKVAAYDEMISLN